MRKETNDGRKRTKARGRSSGRRCGAGKRADEPAAQEHEQREKAEERCVKLQMQVADACHLGEAQGRTVDDLRQQLSFMRQAMQDAGV